jgi:hypothetical protein
MKSRKDLSKIRLFLDSLIVLPLKDKAVMILKFITGIIKNAGW